MQSRLLIRFNGICPQYIALKANQDLKRFVSIPKSVGNAWLQAAFFYICCNAITEQNVRQAFGKPLILLLTG